MQNFSSEKPHITIYTDGACSGNPGEGGWGVYLSFIKTDGVDYNRTLSGYEPLTTNNIMELTAVIMALRALKVPSIVELYSDSAYVINAFNQDWITNWQRNGWKNSANKPVANIELWQELLRLLQIHQVTFIKVKGHANNKYNELCDELARKAITNKKGK